MQSRQPPLQDLGGKLLSDGVGDKLEAKCLEYLLAHTLAYPIEIKSEGRTITAVTMRRSKVRDQPIAAQSGGTSAEMERRLVTFLCPLSPETIDEMDDKDYSALQDIYRRFLS